MVKDIVARAAFALRATAPQESRTERLDKALGVDERITDALCGDRIPVVAGIADERPSIAIWSAEVSGHARRAVPLLFATALAHAGKKVRRCLERPPDMSLDIIADRRKVSGRPVHHHEMEAVVRWRTTKGDVLPDVQLDVVLSNAAEVRVVGTRCYRPSLVLPHSHGTSHERVHTVGADDDPGTLLDRLLALRVATNANDRIVCDEQF